MDGHHLPLIFPFLVQSFRVSLFLYFYFSHLAALALQDGSGKGRLRSPFYRIYVWRLLVSCLHSIASGGVFAALGLDGLQRIPPGQMGSLLGWMVFYILGS